MDKKEMRACVWYVDVTLDEKTDTHTVCFPKPVADFTAVAFLLNHRLRRFSEEEWERLQFETTPALSPES